MTNTWDETIDTALPAREEIQMNEDELLNGMLMAADFKNDDSLQREVKIQRNGKLLFSFTIRPLTEEEIQECRKKVTKRRPDPRGRQFGMIEVSTDYIKMRSYKIWMATVDTGKGILWNNPKLKEKLGVLQEVDVIDMVLMGGEKDRISDLIDEISGYGTDNVSEEDVIKN